jgi:CheY-like chemotaxis protein
LKKKILLADRNSSVQRMVVELLAGEDVEVTAVTDGYAAERSLNENQPDLVLADVFLVGKNGYDLCHSIKQNPGFAGLPVILLVGSFEPFDAAAAARLGADGKLSKPIEPAGLIDMVRRFLGDRNSSADSRDPVLAPLPAQDPMTDVASDAGPQSPQPALL